MKCDAPNRENAMTGQCGRMAHWIVQNVFAGYPVNELVNGEAHPYCDAHANAVISIALADSTKSAAGLRVFRIEHWQYMTEVDNLRGRNRATQDGKAIGRG